jgi:hypothetical protein
VVLAKVESLKSAKLFPMSLHSHPPQECGGSLLAEDPLDLHAMDRHVATAQRQPAMCVHRAEPWMRKFRLCPEIPDVVDGS